MAKFVYLTNSIDNAEKYDVGKVLSEKNNISKVHFIRIDEKLKINSKYITQIDLEQIGDEYEYKICDRCLKYLDIKNFDNNRIKKDNKITKRPSCKTCRKNIEGKRIKANEKRKWESKRPIKDLFECPICKKTTIAGITKIVIDHNHINGKVRGFICESCNTGLGRFKDSVSILENAIKWLKFSKE